MSGCGSAHDRLRNQREDACVFKWKINNISNLEDDAIVRSPWFEDRPNRCYIELKFALETGIGVKLVWDPTRDKTRQYKCSITVQDMDGKLYESHKNVTEYPGFSFGITCTLPNDIVIFCSVSSTESAHCSTADNKTNHERLSSDLKEILELNNGADILMKVQGWDIRAHKAILSARSPVFKSMFLSNMMEASSEVVKVDDVDPKTFGILIKYLYTGILYDDSSDVIYSLYYASDKYQVLELRDICSNVILYRLDCQNVMEVLRLAEKHCDDYLFTGVAHFIGFHLKETSLKGEWLSILTKDASLIERVIDIYAKKKDLREYEFKYNMIV